VALYNKCEDISQRFALFILSAHMCLCKGDLLFWGVRHQALDKMSQPDWAFYLPAQK